MDLFYDHPKPLSGDLDTVLRRRGHAILRTGEMHRTLFWNAATNKTLLAMGQFEHVRHFGRDPLKPYMERFAQHSFRQIVTKIMRAEADGVRIESIRAEAGRRADDYLELLQHLQVVSIEDGVVRWFKLNDNIGPSLEHFVAALCERELRASAVEWSVMLDELEGGGEFDVIASLDPNLIYIECKCSPKNITDAQLRETLRRNEELTPELTVLLFDTQRDIGWLAERTNNVLEEIGQQVSPFRELASSPGVYFGNAQTYLINGKPSILRQIRACLRHFHARVKPTGGYGFDAEAFRAGVQAQLPIAEAETE